MNLSVEQLNFQYKNSRERIFENFDLSVQEGQILAILGKSGSGKALCSGSMRDWKRTLKGLFALVINLCRAGTFLFLLKIEK